MTRQCTIRHSGPGANYRAVNVRVMADTELSITARFILVWMMSCSDGWQFSQKGIQKTLGISLYAVKKALAELKEQGYLVVHRDDSTHRPTYIYEVFDSGQKVKGSRIHPLKSNPLKSDPYNISQNIIDPKNNKRDGGFANKKKVSRPGKAAKKIASKVYGETNPRSPKKAAKAASTIQKLHDDDGFDFSLINRVLTWALKQPGNGSFKGWKHYLQQGGPTYLNRERRGKDQTPFESMLAQWEKTKEPSTGNRVGVKGDEDWFNGKEEIIVGGE